MYDIIGVMKLSRKFDRAMIWIAVASVFLVLACFVKNTYLTTYASGDDDESFVVSESKYVTFYDGDSKLTVKTEAHTVGEALERAGIEVGVGDIVDPGVDTDINADNYHINIYRARPVVVKDGLVDKYIMSASYDAKVIAKEAGITIYDGDEVAMVPNGIFLEGGVATTYEVTRNGGRTITEEVELPYTEESVKDPALEAGKSEIRQVGEVGMKRVYYNVQYIDNVEVSREVVNEEIVREPVARVTAVGVKKALPPASGTCAEWARAAGVSEAELSIALDLIYRESGCRVNATNASSGAYGIPQALPGSKMAAYGADWETNPVTQIRWMISYVNGRYGGWSQAANWWYSHGWY